jgi:hypothetical protein
MLLQYFIYIYDPFNIHLEKNHNLQYKTPIDFFAIYFLDIMDGLFDLSVLAFLQTFVYILNLLF